MTVGVQQNGRRSVGALFRDLAEGSVGLVRNEIKLARVRRHSRILLLTALFLTYCKRAFEWGTQIYIGFNFILWTDGRFLCILCGY